MLWGEALGFHRWNTCNLRDLHYCRLLNPPTRLGFLSFSITYVQLRGEAWAQLGVD